MGWVNPKPLKPEDKVPRKRRRRARRKPRQLTAGQRWWATLSEQEKADYIAKKALKREAERLLAKDD